MPKFKLHNVAFEEPSVAVDSVVFSIKNSKLHVLLIERGDPPYKGFWALPGGFMRPDEPLDAVGIRELKEETGLDVSNVYSEQLYTFGDPHRDPRKRVISVAYLILLPRAQEDLIAATDAANAEWFSVQKLPKLAFDHKQIVRYALERLQNKLKYTNAAHGLLFREFALTELQQVYEIVLDQQLDKRNFRKKILSLEMLEQTKHVKQEGAHRPAVLYRFKTKKLQILNIL